jgi:hypothetical protein
VQECGANRCLRPTTIAYQDGAKGWQTFVDTGVAANPAAAPMPLELNGDGIVDLLYPVSAGTGLLAWRILPGTVNGFGAPFDTGIVSGTSAKVLPGQFAGNGRTQFLIALDGYWHIAGYTNSGFSVASTGLAPSGEYGAADFDGDGLADLLSRVGGFQPTISVRRNVTVPAQAATGAQFAAAAEAIWTVPTGRQSMLWDNLRVADVNGDGRADVIALTYVNRQKDTKFFGTALLSNGFGRPVTVGTETSRYRACSSRTAPAALSNSTRGRHRPPATGFTRPCRPTGTPTAGPTCSTSTPLPASGSPLRRPAMV